MDKIKCYFDNISPEKSPEQIAQNVISNAESSARKRSFRPLTAVAAAAAVMAVGVTAAAATGLLNINDIFGGRISAQDEVLAGELVIAAEDFTWSVSDDDYMIELKGVTGSKSDMLLVYEIKRTDGKPVTDYMTNVPEDGALVGFVEVGFSDESTFSKAMDDNQYAVNEHGNIEIYNRIITNGDLSGQQYSVNGVNLYPYHELWDFLQQQNDRIFMWDHRSDEHPIGFYSYNSFKENKPLDIALNDEHIIGLELTWSIDFTFSPSNTATLSKTIKDTDNTINIDRRNTYSRIVDTLDCKIIQNHFSCVGGWIELEYSGEPKVGDFENYNEIYLITEDKTPIPCTFVSRGYSTLYVNGAVTTIDFEIRYSDTVEGPITAIDISEIEAISINGEIFPLA
ncbi:MAG: hypothetical protein E7478_03315 [Ruminococcaceae bacterium]|nr:hypothetical protein [Oscillospiraceae bacterium]